MPVGNPSFARDSEAGSSLKGTAALEIVDKVGFVAALICRNSPQISFLKAILAISAMIRNSDLDKSFDDFVSLGEAALDELFGEKPDEGLVDPLTLSARVFGPSKVQLAALLTEDYLQSLEGQRSPVEAVIGETRIVDNGDLLT